MISQIFLAWIKFDTCPIKEKSFGFGYKFYVQKWWKGRNQGQQSISLLFYTLLEMRLKSMPHLMPEPIYITTHAFLDNY